MNMDFSFVFCTDVCMGFRYVSSMILLQCLYIKTNMGKKNFGLFSVKSIVKKSLGIYHYHLCSSGANSTVCVYMCVKIYQFGLLDYCFLCSWFIFPKNCHCFVYFVFLSVLCFLSLVVELFRSLFVLLFFFFKFHFIH